jgi:hypothetical protein
VLLPLAAGAENATDKDRCPAVTEEIVGAPGREQLVSADRVFEAVV